MKLGKIKISDTLIREQPMMLLPILTKFVPIHIEGRPHYRDYLYTGLCDDFDDLTEGESIPMYDCTIKQEGNIIIEVKFEKINP